MHRYVEPHDAGVVFHDAGPEFSKPQVRHRTSATRGVSFRARRLLARETTVMVALLLLIAPAPGAKAAPPGNHLDIKHFTRDANNDGVPDNIIIISRRSADGVHQIVRWYSGADGRILFANAYVIKPNPDLNRDGVTDAADLSLLLTTLGPADQAPAGYDLNADGSINMADASVILTNLGQPGPSNQANGCPCSLICPGTGQSVCDSPNCNCDGGASGPGGGSTTGGGGTDTDGDGVPDNIDNCKFNFNPGQSDTNGGPSGDGTGDACDPAHNLCSTTITGPKFVPVNTPATFTAVLDTGAGVPDSVTWTVVSGDNLIAVNLRVPFRMTHFLGGMGVSPVATHSLSLILKEALSTLNSVTLELNTLFEPGQVMLMAAIDNGGQTCVADFEFTILDPRLESVTFGGGNHTIIYDGGMNGEGFTQGSPYGAPHWQDNNEDGDAADPDEHRFPIAYTRDATITIASLKVAGVPAAASFNNITIKGVGGNGEMYEGTVSNAGGLLTLDAPMTADMPLPNSVQAYNPYTISWTLDVPTGEEDAMGEPIITTMAAGSNHNRLYVTLSDPQTSPLFETVIDIACRNAVGVADANTLVAAIYSDFTDRSVARKAIDGLNHSDGAIMQYWVPVGQDNDTVGMFCQLMTVMINPDPGPNVPANLHNVGTCVARSMLLHAAFRAHGVTDAPIVEVTSSYLNDGGNSTSLFLLKNWTFNGPQLIAGVCPGFPYLGFGQGILVTETIDGTGAPGQGPDPNPPGAFFNHFIVIRGLVLNGGVAVGGTIYDPSYGTGPFFSHSAWENSSIAGYQKDCIPPPDGNGAFGIIPAARKDTPAVVETRFDIIIP